MAAVGLQKLVRRCILTKRSCNPDTNQKLIVEISVVSGTEKPAAPGEVETPEVAKNVREDAPPRQPVVMDNENGMYENASDAGEVFVR